MTSRHFYPSADGLVLKSLKGAVLLNPSLKLHSASRTVYTTDYPANGEVAVMSGGGAGHEPAHAGYTGRGMLSACVTGEIFASPSSKQILNTIKFAAFGEDTSSSSTKRDVLIIINNYTGDRLNFGLAIEKARVLFPNVSIDSVVVADDVSLLASPTTHAVGPRGLAGNILVCKLLGAFAHTGAMLNQVKVYGDAVTSNLASIGVALEHCHVPGREELGEKIASDECEVGLGLHNEAGASRRKIGDVQSVVREMIVKILEREDASHLINTGDETVLFMNNLGGISQLEMGALLSDVVDELDARGIHPQRVYLSSFMTSLNAPGFSVSLLNVSAVNHFVTPHGINIDTFKLLDAPTDAHSWLGVRRYWDSGGVSPRNQVITKTVPLEELARHESDHPPADILPATIRLALQSACRAVLAIENELTEYDTVSGDGDCGHTFSAGARAIENDSKILSLSPAALTERIAGILEDVMGGTIGALFGIYLNAYSHALQIVSSASELHSAPLRALDSLSRHTTAKPGDRTVIDALHPFCHVFAASGDLDQAVMEAISGAKKTLGMTPKLGRAAYIGKTEANYNVFDPGAWGVAKLLEGFITGLRRVQEISRN
ncbi:DAK1/DegV-like protein [Macrolepiota fuliginosa MF-IS2]|uniref:DAK1/DegV-like protein n=1 Tax=Macrolepiota fuliginosa MF-IS2 TaxID=1400762 RepID=A0A9P5X552_9AGAR|nr:DAK1/DegV-like protein [Macrolepiota fuliginosa MF-IS2]